jgi:hypothetical protein
MNHPRARYDAVRLRRPEELLVKRLPHPTRTDTRTSFTNSDEEAGTRGPCQSAMHTPL